MATEIADAYIALYTKMPGVKADIERSLGKADAKGAGAKLGNGLGAGISSRSAAIAGAVGGVVAVVAQKALAGITGLIGEATAASDATDKFKQTLSFAGLDTSVIDKVTKQTRKYADQTVFDLSTIQNTTAQLAANGVPNYEKLTEAAGNLNAVAGGNNDTFSSVAMVLTQTAGAGKLTTENWNQLANAIPGASGVLIKALEKSGAFTGNFRDAMAKGEITAGEFNDALMKVGSQPIAVEAAKSTSTLEGAVGNLQATIVGGLSDAFTKMKPMVTGAIGFVSGVLSGFFDWLQPALEGVYEFVVNGNFTKAFREAFNVSEDSDIVGFLFTVRDAIVGLFSLVIGGDFTGALRNAFGWEEDSPMVGFLLSARQAVIDFATSIPTYLGAAFSWVKSNGDWLQAVVVGIGAAVVAFKLWVAVTKAAAAVQLAFNLVMAANPIMLIIMAIAALVAGLIWFFTQTKLGQEIWANFIGFLVDAWNNIVTVATTVWTAVSTFITEAIGNVISWVVAHWGLILTFFIGPLGLVIQWIVEHWGEIVSFFQTALDNIGGFFGTVFGGIGDIIRGAFSGVVDFVKGIFNSVIDLVNGIIGGINSIPGAVSIATFGAMDAFPKIPRLADGGIVSARPGGTLATIGEGRYDEAVVPLSPDVLTRLSGGVNFSQTINAVQGQSAAEIAAIARNDRNYELRGLGS